MEQEESAIKLLLTAKEAANALGISMRKLWSLTKCGEIPHVRIGRSVRYAMADLQDYIKQQRRGGAA